MNHETKNICMDLMTCEILELRGILSAARKSEDELRACIDDKSAEIREQCKLAHERDKEIARLKSELATRKTGMVIRNHAWSQGDWLSISLSGTLARKDEHGRVLYSVDANTTGWEEIPAPVTT